MSVRQVREQPEQLSKLFNPERFEWFWLGDEHGEYAVAALAEAEDECLEAHMEVTDWGLRARRGLAKDVVWLKQYARKKGRKRILCVRYDAELDPRWPKFLKLYGFTDYAVVQTAFLHIDGEDET